MPLKQVHAHSTQAGQVLYSRLAHSSVPLLQELQTHATLPGLWNQMTEVCVCVCVFVCVRAGQAMHVVMAIIPLAKHIQGCGEQMSVHYVLEGALCVCVKKRQCISVSARVSE